MAENFLQAPGGDVPPPPTRQTSSYSPLRSFNLPKGEAKHYQQQYGQMYFTRLEMLRPSLNQIANDEWADFDLRGNKVQHVHRVLDVRQGQLCWVVGTVYMDMPLKPNVLDDISAEQAIAVPPPREKYVSDDGMDQVMIEDQSGRLRLVGAVLHTTMLVTGCIMAVMGTENASGEFEVIDLRVPDLARQPQRWEREDTESVVVSGTSKRKKATQEERKSGGKIAVVSGLGITGDLADSLRLDMLMEYLTGEMGTPEDAEEAGKISRLIIAGGSIVASTVQDAKDILSGKKQKKTYGYDASQYNPQPTLHLDRFLAEVLPTIPVTLMPGESDPANATFPQQPLHPALFPQSRSFGAPPNSDEPGWLDCVTNPWQGDIDGWRFLGNAGQPIDDVFKYVHGEDRIEMMECLLRWRNGAPTAPDTLWCYPFQGKDPFIMQDCPHVYFVANQPGFDTTTIEGPAGQQVRLVAVPQFHATGEIVIIDCDTLEPELLKVAVLDET